MPVVPVLKSQVKTAPVSGARAGVDAPAGAFGASEARGLQDLGAGMEKAVAPFAVEMAAEARKRKDLLDTAKTQEAYRVFQDKTRDVFHKVMTERQRGAAEGATGFFDAELGKIAAEVEKSLLTENQKLAFKSLTGNYRAAKLESLSNWEQGQLAEYRKASAMAVLEGAAADAAADPSEKGVALNRELILGTVANLAKIEGLSQVEQDNLSRKALTELHTGVLAGIAVKSADAAKAYFEKHRPDMDGVEAAKWEKELQSLGDKEAGIRLADSITDKAGSLSEALKMAREIKDPDQREIVEQRARTWFNDLKAAQENSRKAGIESAFTAFDAAPTFTGKQDIIHALPPGKLRSGLQTMLDRQAEDAAFDMYDQARASGDPERVKEVYNALPGKLRQKVRSLYADDIPKEEREAGRYDKAKETALIDAADSGAVKDIADLLEFKPYVRADVYSYAEKKMQAAEKGPAVKSDALKIVYDDRQSLAPSSDEYKSDWAAFYIAFSKHSEQTGKADIDSMSRFADLWFRNARGTENTFWNWSDPDTVGEFIKKGRTDWLIDPPEDVDLVETRALLGAALAGTAAARVCAAKPDDVFYSGDYIRAADTLAGMGLPETPANVAAAVALSARGTRATRKKVEALADDILKEAGQNAD